MVYGLGLCVQVRTCVYDSHGIRLGVVHNVASVEVPVHLQRWRGEIRVALSFFVVWVRVKLLGPGDKIVYIHLYVQYIFSLCGKE